MYSSSPIIHSDVLITIRLPLLFSLSFYRMSTTHTCCREGCGKPATKKCPTCIQYGLPDSFFCSQECLRAAWKVHKKYHEEELEKM